MFTPGCVSWVYWWQWRTYQRSNSGGEWKLANCSEAADDGPAEPHSVVLNETTIHPNDLAIAFATDRPLGKVLLKQMADLKSITGCDSPELKTVLDGLMSQIRSMRQAAHSKTTKVSGRGTHTSRGLVTPVVSEDVESFACDSSGNNSCPQDSGMVSDAPSVCNLVPLHVLSSELCHDVWCCWCIRTGVHPGEI